MPEISPRLGVTMGDPCGAGPASLAKLLNTQADLPPILYFGAMEALEVHGYKGIAERVNSPNEAAALPDDTLAIMEGSFLSQPLSPGQRNDALSPNTIECLDAGVTAALSGGVSALITCPIHKESLYTAGFRHPGHTEYLAERSGLGPDDIVMMLASPMLKVVPLTIHIPLSEVSKRLTTEVIIKKTLIVHQALKRQFGIEEPRLVLAGLNPHAGEGGSIGHEEATHIQPALWALEDMGINVDGPLSADTLFHAEARAAYDAALCCYHDQALIPIKTLDIWGGVNVTLGLPFVRTSPDHGTAFDAVKAGSLKPDSLLAAIRMANTMSGARRLPERL